MENASRPVYDGRSFIRGVNTTVVVHEPAHQWRPTHNRSRNVPGATPRPAAMAEAVNASSA